MWDFFLAMSAEWAQKLGQPSARQRQRSGFCRAVELGSAVGSLESEAGVAETKKYPGSHTAVVCLPKRGEAGLVWGALRCGLDFHKKMCTKAEARGGTEGI